MFHLIYNRLDIPAVLAEREALPSLSLLTFRAGEEGHHLPGAVLRWFKDRSHRDGADPAVRALAQALGEQMARWATARGWQVDIVCRALGSWETRPSRECPLETPAAAAADRLGATLAHPFRRTTTRPPMSVQKHLAASGALEKRIRYAARDLTFDGSAGTDGTDGRSVLIVDDIRCLGASEAMLAWALRTFGEAKNVYAVSLAQAAGLDSRQEVIETAVDGLASRADSLLGGGRLDFAPALHRKPDCPAARDRLVEWWSGIGAGTRDCPHCTPGHSPIRAWLSRLRQRDDLR